MDQKRLEEIRAREKAATPPPWIWREWTIDAPNRVSEAIEAMDADARFIDHVREDVQFLLEALDEAHDLIRILSTDSEAYRQGLSDGRNL